MNELRTGDTRQIFTDIRSLSMNRHDRNSRHTPIEWAAKPNRFTNVHRRRITYGTDFFLWAYEFRGADLLEQGLFGSIPNVVGQRANVLNDTIDAVNATGFGLTLGIHSGIDETVCHVQSGSLARKQYVISSQADAVIAYSHLAEKGLQHPAKTGWPIFWIARR